MDDEARIALDLGHVAAVVVDAVAVEGERRIAKTAAPGRVRCGARRFHRPALRRSASAMPLLPRRRQAAVDDVMRFRHARCLQQFAISCCTVTKTSGPERAALLGDAVDARRARRRSRRSSAALTEARAARPPTCAAAAPPAAENRRVSACPSSPSSLCRGDRQEVQSQCQSGGKASPVLRRRRRRGRAWRRALPCRRGGEGVAALLGAAEPVFVSGGRLHGCRITVPVVESPVRSARSFSRSIGPLDRPGRSFRSPAALGSVRLGYSACARVRFGAGSAVWSNARSSASTLRSRLCSLSRPNRPMRKVLKSGPFVALQRHAAGELQTLATSIFLPLCSCRVGGVAHDHARRLEALGGHALEALFRAAWRAPRCRAPICSLRSFSKP